MFSKIYDSLLTLGYPQSCTICRKSVERSSDGTACESCWDKTRLFTGRETLCHKCGAFLKESPSEIRPQCNRCGEQFYDLAISVGIYEHALSAVILNLKKEPFIPKKLRRLFIDRFLNGCSGDIDLVIPVPLSEGRRLERGFNQAEVLAETLSKTVDVKVDKQSLIRKIHTPMHRAGMDRKARELTVQNAFEVKRKRLITGKRVLLVDDVFTSGATVSNCAKALKSKGAGRVTVLTVARTI